MQKKSKSRKRPFRKKSKKRIIRKPVKNITNAPKMDVSKGVWAADAPVEYDSPKYAMKLSNSNQFEELLGITNLKTRMEFYCRSKVSVQSLDVIYAESYKQAILIVRHGRENEEEKFTTVFDAAPNFKITFSNIERIVLREVDSDKWFVTFTYIDDQNVEQMIDLTFNGESTVDLKNAIGTIIDTLADLIVRYGIDNPDCGIQKRLFKFSEVLFVVPLDRYRQLKDDIQTSKFPLLAMEEIEKAFQKTMNVLGGGFTSKDAHKLDSKTRRTLDELIVHALEHGVWTWPFTNSNA